MSTQQPTESTQSTKPNSSKDSKHPYIPLSARKVQRGRNYASTMVNDQKTMMENLRFLRHQMEKEERQLKVMSERLYKHSLPNRQTEERPKAVMSCKSEPFLPVTSYKSEPFLPLTSYKSEPFLPTPPAFLNTSTLGNKANVKDMAEEMRILKKKPTPLYYYNVNGKKSISREQPWLLKVSPQDYRRGYNLGHPEVQSASKDAEARWSEWRQPGYKQGYQQGYPEVQPVSKEAEARWSEWYLKFLSRYPGEVRPAGRMQVDNGRRSVLVQSVPDQGKRNSLPYNPVWSLSKGTPIDYRSIPEEGLNSVISNVLQQVSYEKNGRRFNHYSGLGEDGQWLLKAVDSFYCNRFGGY